MKALRTSSVAGLETTLQANQTSITNHINAISILNGGASTEGSLAKTLADMNAYTDTLTGEIDTTQIDANTTAIALLNDTTSGKVGSIQTQFQAVQTQAGTYADTTIVEGTSGQISAIRTDIETITGFVGDYIPASRNSLNYSNYYPKVDNLNTTGYNIWVCDAATDTDTILNDHPATDKRSDLEENVTLKVGDKVLYQYAPAQDGADEYFYIRYVQRKDGEKIGDVYVPADCDKEPYTGESVEDTDINDVDNLYVRTSNITLSDYAATFNGDGDNTDIYYATGLDGNTVLEAGWVLNAWASNGTQSNADQDDPGTNNEVHFASIKNQGTIINNGTLKTKFDELINNADVMHDTLNELLAEDASYQQEISDLTTVVDANKTSIENALQAHKDNYASDKTAINDKFADERSQIDNDILVAVTNYNTTAEGKFFAIGGGNPFDGINSDDAGNCRYNIDATAPSYLPTNFIFGYSRQYKLETLTVKKGKIYLPTDVTPAMLKHIHLEYPGHEYDTLTHIVGENPGEFIVQDQDAGDLDDVDVSVRYVTKPVAGDNM